MSLRIPRSGIVAALAFMLAGGGVAMCGPSVCFAEDAAPAVKDFSPPTVFDSREMNLENIEERIYKVTGVVDAVTDKAVCIGDVLYPIASEADVSCRVGSFVGIRVNDEGQVIACEPVRFRR